MFGIDFAPLLAILGKLPWKWIGAIAAILAVCGGLYLKGRADDAAKWKPRLEASAAALRTASAALAQASLDLKRDVGSASDQTAACSQANTDALHAGEAIERIIHAPVVVSPVDHCPVRAIVGAGELRSVFEPAATEADLPH